MTAHYLFAKWSRRGEVERIIYNIIGTDDFTRADVVRLALEQGGVLSKLQTKSRRAAVDDAIIEMRNFKRVEITRPAGGRGEAHIYRCVEIPEAEDTFPVPDRPASTMTIREELIARLACAMASNAEFFFQACPEGVRTMEYVNSCAIEQADALIAAMEKRR